MSSSSQDKKYFTDYVTFSAPKLNFKVDLKYILQRCLEHKHAVIFSVCEEDGKGGPEAPLGSLSSKEAFGLVCLLLQSKWTPLFSLSHYTWHSFRVGLK